MKNTLTNSDRYIILINYLISNRTDMDDLIIDCTTKDEFDKVIDTIILPNE